MSARLFWPIVTLVTGGEPIETVSLTVPHEARKYRREARGIANCRSIHRWLGQSVGDDDWWCGGGANIDLDDVPHIAPAHYPPGVPASGLPLGYWIVRDPLGGPYRVMQDADFKSSFARAITPPTASAGAGSGPDGGSNLTDGAGSVA